MSMPISGTLGLPTAASGAASGSSAVPATPAIAGAGATAVAATLLRTPYVLPTGTTLMATLGPAVGVPTGVSATLGDVPGEVNISRVIGVGLANPESKLDTGTVTKVKAEYAKLKKLIVDNITKTDSSHALASYKFEQIQVQVNTFSREAYCWVADGSPNPVVHTIHLGHDQAYVDGMTAMKQAARPNSRSIERSAIGVSGNMSNPTALRSHDLGSKDPRSQTLKDYATSYLVDMRKAKGADALKHCNPIMNKLSAVDTYLTYINEFLNGQISACNKRISDKKIAGATAIDIAQEERLLGKLQKKLEMCSNVDLLAVFFRLSQSDTIAPQLLAANYKNFLQDIVKVKPKNEEELLKYTHAAAALVVPQEEYSKHCVDHGLDLTQSMPLEQFLCSKALSGAPAVGLFDDIQDVPRGTFQSELQTALTKAQDHVASRQGAIGKVGGTEVKEQIKYCLSAHATAPTKLAAPVTPTTPRRHVVTHRRPVGAPTLPAGPLPGRI